MISLLIPLLLAGAVEKLTSAAGARECTTLNIVGEYYTACTAWDSEGNESGLSNQLLMTYPKEICWENPTENMDGTLLTDLTKVRCYYSAEPFSSVFEPPPGPPDLGDMSASCATDCENHVGTLHIGTTGDEVSFQWTGEGVYQLQLVEWGKDTPILVGSSGTNEWRFTPTRAGLYEVRLRLEGEEWIRSSERGLAFYFRLASATDGGIE